MNKTQAPNATLTLHDGFRLRNGKATTLVATLKGEALAKTIATAAALGEAGEKVELIFHPTKSGRTQIWAHVRDRKAFAQAANGWTSRGVVDFDHDGTKAGAAIVFDAEAIALLAPFARLGSIDLIVTRETLEVHTPRIGMAALGRLGVTA